MAIDLLCTITFQPEGGHDPEDLSGIEKEWWQTLIHDLDATELEVARESVRSVVTDMESQPTDSLPEHLQTKLSVLKQFLNGELN